MTEPLLCADIGNSHTTVGLVRRGEVSHHWRVKTDEGRTADEWGVLLGALLAGADVHDESGLCGVSVCSSVPAVLHEWRQMMEGFYPSVPHVVVEAGVKTGVPVLELTSANRLGMTLSNAQEKTNLVERSSDWAITRTQAAIRLTAIKKVTALDP